MVFLINIVPFLIALLGFIVFYFSPGWKRKVGTVLIVIGLSVIYHQVQPSYMSKGTVKQLPNAEFKVSTAEIVDRGLKTKSSEQYDIERKEEMDAIDKSIKEQIYIQSQNKE